MAHDTGLQTRHLSILLWEPHIPRPVNLYSPTIPDPCPSSLESAGAYFYIFILITYYYLTPYYMCVGARFSSEPHGFPSHACRTLFR